MVAERHRFIRRRRAETHHNGFADPSTYHRPPWTPRIAWLADLITDAPRRTHYPRAPINREREALSDVVHIVGNLYAWSNGERIIVRVVFANGDGRR